MSSRYGLEIRAATAGDAAGLAELLGVAMPNLTPRDVADRLEALHRQPGAVLLALEWGPPSGVIALHWYATLEAPQPTARITTLLVGPDHRRRGIGRLLLKAASQAARMAGCDELELLASPDQPALRAFCGGCGFSGTGLRFVRGLRRKR